MMRHDTWKSIDLADTSSTYLLPVQHQHNSTISTSENGMDQCTSPVYSSPCCMPRILHLSLADWPTTAYHPSVPLPPARMWLCGQACPTVAPHMLFRRCYKCLHFCCMWLYTLPLCAPLRRCLCPPRVLVLCQQTHWIDWYLFQVSSHQQRQSLQVCCTIRQCDLSLLPNVPPDA